MLAFTHAIVAVNPSYLQIICIQLLMYSIVLFIQVSSHGRILKLLNVFFFAAKGYVSSGNISGLP